MLNKLGAFVRNYDLIQEGDRVTCAVSGGADSVALLFGLYLLKDKLKFTLCAAHFNHHLRGEESDRDEEFVRRLCQRLDIPLTVGGEQVVAGAKGLEAAARDARYRFLRSLPGKIATAHTADDNAETVLMHMLRGTGLKGLGGIKPINGSVIRPMLTVTRRDVEDFLEEYCLRHIEDSSNSGDDFLRNRIRHQIMPLMRRENPAFASSASAMALRLRQDEEFIQSLLEPNMPGVTALRQLHPSLRYRYLERFLKESGVCEPEQAHIAMAEALVMTPKPSAKADFPGGITLARNYDTLEVLSDTGVLPQTEIRCPGITELPQWGYRVVCEEATGLENGPLCFTVQPKGAMYIRSRMAGDSIRLPGGTKSVKKLMIDRKIPAASRNAVPILADDTGILAIGTIGVNETVKAKDLPAVTIRMIPVKDTE